MCTLIFSSQFATSGEFSQQYYIWLCGRTRQWTVFFCREADTIWGPRMVRSTRRMQPMNGWWRWTNKRKIDCMNKHRFILSILAIAGLPLGISTLINTYQQVFRGEASCWSLLKLYWSIRVWCNIITQCAIQRWILSLHIYIYYELYSFTPNLLQDRKFIALAAIKLHLQFYCGINSDYMSSILNHRYYLWPPQIMKWNYFCESSATCYLSSQIQINRAN